MATYGGPSDNNIFDSPVDPGKKLYVEIDATTGEQTYWERKGSVPPIKLGTMTPPDNEFEVHDPPFGQNGFFEVFNEQQRKEFLKPENLKKLRDQATETSVRAQIEAGVDEVNARKRTEELLTTGKQTTPTDADPETTLNEQLNELSNLKINQREGTKTDFGAALQYPRDRLSDQDFMKFTLLEYKPKTVGSGTGGTGFGFGDRGRVGPNGQSSDRKILGSVSLPIPGGIKDANGADWSGKTMNEMEIQTSALARALLGQGEDSGTQAAEKIVSRLGNNSEVVKTAIGEAMAGKAAGVQGLLARTRGAIFNPNLELLFDKPTLRGFQFSFDLVPRNKEEADEVVKIIRFFKQGMSPIRSEANLFLLAPYVFQVHYILKGDTSKDHPYIGKMKECAMTNFAVDYTPQQNYSTLTDGYMTAYKITMDLKELEPVFNDDYGTENVAEIGF